MNQPASPNMGQFDSVLSRIDESIQAHLAWNQRLMRCALLRESPGEDMLLPDAHRRCTFGRWFTTEREVLDRFDAGCAEELDRHHQSMHGAVRVLCTESLRGVPARAEDLAQYETGQTGMMECLRKLRLKVAESVLQPDALTGLPLRNGLDYAFRLRQKDAARGGQPLYLVIVDVDHFKLVNDTWGHAVGDLALQHLARLMSGCLRENDIAIRYGGEEFLFLLVGPGGEVIVRRLLDEVRSHPMAMAGGDPLAVTVTAGLTVVTENDTLMAAIDRADRALLQGKRQGRDCYVVAA